jgi:hypothetical protein
MRKFIIAAASVVALAVPSVASANVTVDNGVGYVGKGEVQTALKLNNSGFDTGTFVFTADFTATYDNTLTCRSGQVTHVPVVSTGTGDLKAEAVKSSNGKQITGWNLTGAGAVASSNDQSQIVARLWTACDDGSIPVGVNVASTPTVTLDGLAVNGTPLPNTPEMTVPVA